MLSCFCICILQSSIGIRRFTWSQIFMLCHTFFVLFLSKTTKLNLLVSFSLSLVYNIPKLSLFSLSKSSPLLHIMQTFGRFRPCFIKGPLISLVNNIEVAYNWVHICLVWSECTQLILMWRSTSELSIFIKSIVIA